MPTKAEGGNQSIANRVVLPFFKTPPAIYNRIMKLKLMTILSGVWLLLPLAVGAQNLNAGFVEGLWYSRQEFFAGDMVRVYVALRNSSQANISTTIEFFDNDKLIGSKSVDALSGRLIETWTDWEATAGKHKLTARLSDLVIDEVGKNTKTEPAVDNLATDNLLIDTDSDSDNIGNQADPDDDNDGVPDLTEIERGTNPLVADNPEVAIPDATAKALNQTDSLGGETGLEQFFADGAVRHTLTDLTELIGTARDNLNEHLVARQRKPETKTIIPKEPSAATGSVTSSQNQETVITRSGGDDEPVSLWQTGLKLASNILNAGYNACLGLLIFILA